MSMQTTVDSEDSACREHLRRRAEFWDGQAEHPSRTLGGYYRRWIERTMAQVVPQGSKVLDLGCGDGHLLASLRPAAGVGVDLSQRMVEAARRLHPGLRFERMPAERLDLRGETFDYIIASDLLNDVWDAQRVLERARAHCAPGTRLVINVQSHLWSGPLRAAGTAGLARPVLTQNWLTVHDVTNLLELSGFEVVRHWSEFVVPAWFPGADLLNRFPGRIAPARWLAMSNFVVARPRAAPGTGRPTCTVLVPARNEAGNIDSIIDRIPDLGGGTEIIFVEGNSTDDTFGAIERAIARRPDRNCRLLKQPGRGKGDAVRCGFDAAGGDILLILDADMTVPPEDLPRFIAPIVDGTGDFVNGVRLVYPMEDEAMRFANLVGNKFFAAAFSWLLGQPIRDTLCGTKVLRRSDYRRVAANRSYFGDFDPFGDFDLLFGAARLDLKIVELPVRYRSRTYGTTNISRWRHGMLLLRMVVFAARRLKFA